jgi:signal transduction histidine kinase
VTRADTEVVPLPANRFRLDGGHLADGAVALLVLAVVYAPFLIPRANQPGPFSPWAWVFEAGTALPLIWRRRYPILCLLAIFASLVAYNTVSHVASEPIAWGLLVAAYSIAWGGRRGQQIVVLLVVGGTALATSKSLTTSVIGLLTTTGAYVVGILARRREIRMRALAHRAGEMERARELDLARAATAERARIARDMHDILAHAVSLMVVQAEAGPVVVRASPERAVQAFDAIAGAGRDAMVQIRRMLGLLKDDAVDDTRAPQPTIAGVAELVAHVGATPGLAVDLQRRGEPRPLPADAEVAAYRIVQEALTNTVKHARAARAAVLLEWTGAALMITVTDDGCGENGPPGYGLVGIRERAAACGGTAQAGPMPGGGHRVTASLPYAGVPA